MERGHFFHKNLNRDDEEERRHIFKVRDCKNEIVFFCWDFSGIKGAFVLCFDLINFSLVKVSIFKVFVILFFQLFLPFSIIFELVMVTAFEFMMTVSDHDYICIFRMHLIESVNAILISFVVEYEYKNYGFFLMSFFTINKSNWSVFHFSCSHGLSMNIVELFYFKSCFFGDAHAFSLSQYKN